MSPKCILHIFLVIHLIKADLPDFHTNFYEYLSQIDLQLVSIPGRGFGTITGKYIHEGSVFLCIDRQNIIISSDVFEYSEIIKGWSPSQRLAVRLLYEKYVSTTNSFFKQYAESLSTSILTTEAWNETHHIYFQNLTILPYNRVDFDVSSGYQQFKSIFGRLPNVPPIMVEKSSYNWAIFHVFSRGFEHTKKESALYPLLDLVNHWPSPYKNRKHNFSYTNETQVCLVSWRNATVGEELFIDYGHHDSLDFLLNYGFVIENNPYDRVYFKYLGSYPLIDPEDKYFFLYGDMINIDLLEAFIYDFGICMKFSKRFRTSFDSGIGPYQQKIATKSLNRYRNEFKAYFRKAELGIRELRRQTLDEDPIFKLIRMYAIASRKTFYNHLAQVDRSLIFCLFKLIFMK